MDASSIKLPFKTASDTDRHGAYGMRLLLPAAGDNQTMKQFSVVFGGWERKTLSIAHYRNVYTFEIAFRGQSDKKNESKTVVCSSSALHKLS